MSVGLQIKHYSLLLWTLLIVSTDSNKVKGNLSDARKITNFIEEIIKPKSNRLFDVKRRFLAKDNIILLPEIETEIKLKVKELKPILQDEDNDYTRRVNNFKFDKSEETIILELVPENRRRANTLAITQTEQLTNTLHKNIKYYKQLRQNITKMLDEVKIASSTKTLITRTFDEILSLLINQQCQKKSINTRDVFQHLDKDMRKSIPKVNDIFQFLQRQKNLYNGVEFMDNTGNASKITNEILPQLLLPLNTLLEKYKIKCYLDHKEKPKNERNERTRPSVEAQSLSIRSNDQCESFIVCSNELTDFLKIIYNSLKSIAVSSFANYKDWFKRTKLNETKVEDLNKTIQNILRSKFKDLHIYIEKEFQKIFIKHVKFFTLDKNKNKIANIQLINNFHVILREEIIKSVTGLLLNVDYKFKPFFTMNFRLDLETVSDQLTAELCDFFELCNGRRIQMRKEASPLNTLQKLTFGNVYVKVQNSSNDEKPSSNFGEQKFNSVQGNVTSLLRKSMIDAVNHRKYIHKNVTRTTIRSTATTKGPVRKHRKFFLNPNKIIFILFFCKS